MPHTLFYYNYSSEPPWGSSLNIPLVSFGNPFQDIREEILSRPSWAQTLPSYRAATMRPFRSM